VKKNKKGFTLIELLAVIVILGLLMAIAIPSITRYITQSRKKTAVSTAQNYMSALINEVNALEYTFTGTDTVYAVPIECISVERGGKSPFGEWLQANNAYWGYVLVQYDELNSSYTYGFTFKDSAGYGMYPTSEDKITSDGSQIQTGLNLTRPVSGKIDKIASVDKWTGFDVNSNTELVVLESEEEGQTGDGEKTCTLCQKGPNYDIVEKEKKKTLVELIKKYNPLISNIPTLTTSSNNSSDESGLYSSTDTNNGKATYYFRGNVTNNNVSFAGQNWHIVRINEDGTIRMILNGSVVAGEQMFNSSDNGYSSMYYSNKSNAKQQVDNWYKKNISDKGYDSYVATTTFCEQAKVIYSSSWTSGNATMKLYNSYVPNFKCENDGNGKGILNDKVGLITIDESMYAGGYYFKSNSDYYLNIGSYGIWTMSPAGVSSTYTGLWSIGSNGSFNNHMISGFRALRPVINLNANVEVTGTGTSSDPYVVQTN